MGRKRGHMKKIGRYHTPWAGWIEFEYDDGKTEINSEDGQESGTVR